MQYLPILAVYITSYQIRQLNRWDSNIDKGVFHPVTARPKGPEIIILIISKALRTSKMQKESRIE